MIFLAPEDIHDIHPDPPHNPVSMAGWIADHGLLDRLAVSLEGPSRSQRYRVIAGRRRLAAIRLLIARNTLVHDNVTGLKSPATEVYRTIPCVLLDMECN